MKNTLWPVFTKDVSPSLIKSSLNLIQFIMVGPNTFLVIPEKKIVKNDCPFYLFY